MASLGLSLLLRSLTTERRRSSLKSLLPDGKNLGFSRQTPVFPGFAGVLETRQNPGKQGVNHYKNTLTPLRFSVLPDSPFIKTGNSNRARKGNREHEKNFNRPPQVPLSSRGSLTFFFLYFFLKWGYFFFFVGYFFLTFSGFRKTGKGSKRQQKAAKGARKNTREKKPGAHGEARGRRGEARSRRGRPVRSI